MIFTLIDLTIATAGLAIKGVYSGTKYAYNWYYEIEEPREPTIKDLQIELKNMSDILDDINKQKKSEIDDN